MAHIAENVTFNQGDFKGGWQFEGKERPVTPVICVRCQGSEEQEPDKDYWCEPCLLGDFLGHVPEGYKKPVTSKLDDVKDYNKAFFG